MLKRRKICTFWRETRVYIFWNVNVIHGKLHSLQLFKLQRAFPGCLPWIEYSSGTHTTSSVAQFETLGLAVFILNPHSALRPLYTSAHPEYHSPALPQQSCTLHWEHSLCSLPLCIPLCPSALHIVGIQEIFIKIICIDKTLTLSISCLLRSYA